jgi:TPR repeat protein
LIEYPIDLQLVKLLNSLNHHATQRAVDLGRKATEANNPKGMLLLALMYENGRDLPRDLVAARELYQNSVDLGDTFANEQLERLDKGSKTQR